MTRADPNRRGSDLHGKGMELDSEAVRIETLN